jgi:hypothetical protein
LYIHLSDNFFRLWQIIGIVFAAKKWIIVDLEKARDIWYPSKWLKRKKKGKRTRMPNAVISKIRGLSFLRFHH